MFAKKLLVAGLVGTAMMFTANAKTASAAPPRVRVVARPYYGAYWNRPYYYSYPTTYVSAVPAPVPAPCDYTYAPYWNSGVYVGAPRVGIRIGR